MQYRTEQQNLFHSQNKRDRREREREGEVGERAAVEMSVDEL